MEFYTKDDVMMIKSTSVRFTGYVAELMDRFILERINSDDGRNVVYQEAEDAFLHKLDDASGVIGIWQGEFWGKWILSAAQVCDYSGNKELKEFIHSAALKLMTYQDDDGYLGTYQDSLMMFAADTEKSKALMGWPCNWNWNIWCRKYTLWGLLEAWRISDDAAILQAARRLADHLIGQLRDNNIRLADTGTFAGLPSCSILKPMVLLYNATGSDKYLEFAQEIVDDLDRADGKAPNLIGNTLSGNPIHEWYPDVPQWAKAYEMMSCVEGMLSMYRVTGEDKLLAAAEDFHALVKKHELNILFSVGFNDIFNHGASQMNAISEPCDVIHWMRLCHDLFSLTGRKSYLDDFELAFYNPFLAGVFRDGKWGARGVRSHGHHYTVFEQAKFKHNHCCVNNVPRGFTNAADTMVMADDDAVYVNLYSDFKTTIAVDSGDISLTVSGDYLRSGKVDLAFDATLTCPVKLKLRIPGWATSSKLVIGGETMTGDSDWFEMILSSGRTNISLEFGRKLVVRNHVPPTADQSGWYEKRWVANEDIMRDSYRLEPGATLVYGPLLLARSKYIDNSEIEMFGPALSDGFSCSLQPVTSDNVNCAYEATFCSDGKEYKTMICDYASAANEVLVNDPHFFSIFF